MLATSQVAQLYSCFFRKTGLKSEGTQSAREGKETQEKDAQPCPLPNQHDAGATAENFKKVKNHQEAGENRERQPKA